MHSADNDAELGDDVLWSADMTFDSGSFGSGAFDNSSGAGTDDRYWWLWIVDATPTMIVVDANDELDPL